MATPVQIRESLVPFRARILAAVPGVSRNRRTYTKEVLQQAAPLYEGKPFILDHDVMDSRKVVGIITRPRYGAERGMDGNTYEGLWLDAVGLMEEDLYTKMTGSPSLRVPPLVRGVSIGGEGEGDWSADGGVVLKKFMPAELSTTPFPGIDQAHVAAINMIRESLARRSSVHEHKEAKKSTNPAKEISEVSLEDAEKQAAADSKRPTRYVREADVPNPASGNMDDGRDNIPATTRSKPVLHVAPQPTTAADTGLRIDPMVHNTTKTPFLARGATVSGSGGRRNGNPTEKAPGTAADRGARGSADADELPIKTPVAGQSTTIHPGPGKLSKSGTGMPDQAEEEEEEETSTARAKSLNTREEMMAKDEDEGEEEENEEALRDLGQQDNPSPKAKNKIKQPAVGRTTTQTPGFGNLSPSGTGLTDQDEEEESEEESFKVKQDDAATGAKGKNPFEPGEEEEEDSDGMAVNPILKTAQRAIVNPIKSGGEEANYRAPPDIVPVQARAFSLPYDTGIYQQALRIDKMRNPDRTKEAQEYIDAWAKAKQPKQPALKRVTVTAEKGGDAARAVQESTFTPGTRSLIPTIQPTIAARAVPTRAQENLTPTMPLIQATAQVSSIGEAAVQALGNVDKEPFNYWNRAGRAWRELINQGKILQVR